MQHGLGLVVGRVAGHDPASAHLTGDFHQPIVADAPGRRLQVGAFNSRLRRHVDPSHAQVQGRNAGGRQPGVEVHRKSLVGIALGATKLMIEMGNDDRKRDDPGSRPATSTCSSATLSGPPETAATTPRP